jgi:O-antigen/teichoic acid export membrane protein
VLNLNSLLYFAARAGNGIFALASIAIFTRFLSPEEYGLYALGLALATVCSGAFFNWINAVYGRFIHSSLYDSINVESVVTLGFFIATTLVGIFFISLSYTSIFFEIKKFNLGLLFVITVFLGIHSFALQIANSLGYPLIYVLLSWAKGGGSLVVGFLLVFYGFGAMGAMFGFLSGLIIANLILFNYYSPRFIFLRIKMDSVRNMFFYGIPLTINYLAIAFIDVADRFMIASLLGYAKVAPYAAAYDLTQQCVGPIMNVVYLAAFPLILKATKNDGSDCDLIEKLGNKLLLYGLPITAVLGVLAPDITSIVLGDGYRDEAALVMPWLAFGIFVACFKSYFLDLVFQIKNKTKYLGYIALLMAAVNILLNLFLLPQFGLVSAAWATLISFLVGAFASMIFGKSLYPLPNLSKAFFVSGGSSLLLALFLHMLPETSGAILIALKVVAGICMYVLFSGCIHRLIKLK